MAFPTLSCAHTTADTVSMPPHGCNLLPQTSRQAETYPQSLATPRGRARISLYELQNLFGSGAWLLRGQALQRRLFAAETKFENCSSFPAHPSWRIFARLLSLMGSLKNISNPLPRASACAASDCNAVTAMILAGAIWCLFS